MTAQQKRELLALPIAPPPSLNIPATTETQVHDYYGGQRTRTIHNYRYTVTLHGTVICMTLFAHDGKPLFRTFQAPDDLVSQYLNEDKPRTSNATLYRTDCTVPTSGHYDNKWNGTAEDDKLLYSSLASESPLYLKHKPDDNGFHFLASYQNRLREYQVKKKHDKIRAELDSHMLEIRPLPKKVKDWVRSTVMRHSRYLFYDYRKGGKPMTAVCTHCGRTVQIVKPRHMTEGRCPACHTTATYVAKGKHSDCGSMDDRGQFAYLQSTKAGWCVRYFDVYVCHRVQATTHNGGGYSYQEQNRDFYRRGEVYPEQCFAWENFRNTGSYCFCRSCHSGCSAEVLTYPSNLDQLLRPSDPYTPYREIAAKCGSFSPARLIRNAPSNRQIEYLYKRGLYQLCGDMINGDIRGDITADTLHTVKANIKQLQLLNLNHDGLWLFCKIYEQHRRVDSDTLLWLLQIRYRRGEIATIIHYQSPEVARRYIEKQTAALMAVKVTAAQCSHGCYGSRPETAAERLASTRQRVVGDWEDYLQECDKLGLDTHDRDVLRPRDLQAAHEQTSAQLRTVRDQKERVRAMKIAKQETKDITKLAQQLAKDYSYTSDDLMIRPLMTRDEVKAEGEALKHCVGGYADRYASGDTYLFAIRRTAEPDKPYYTLEFDPKTQGVRQYRGYRNDGPNGGVPAASVTAFKAKWLREVVQKLGQKKPKRVKVPA